MMRMRNGVVLRALIFAIVLAGCNDPVGPSQVSLDGLELALSVEPAVVQPRGSFQVELTIRNTLPDTTTLLRSCSALAWIGVYHGDVRVGFRGTENGCFPVITTFRIPPGGVLTHGWTVTAENASGAVDGGDYVVRVDAQVSGVRHLEHALRVE